MATVFLASPGKAALRVMLNSSLKSVKSFLILFTSNVPSGTEWQTLESTAPNP